MSERRGRTSYFSYRSPSRRGRMLNSPASDRYAGIKAKVGSATHAVYLDIALLIIICNLDSQPNFS